jgi:hypothetical protein
MKIKTKFLKKDSGQVIMFVIFVVLFLVLFVSLFISRSLMKQSKASLSVANSVQAYYIADTGTENTLYYLNEHAEKTFFKGEEIPLDNLFGSMGGDCAAYASEVTGVDILAKIDIVGTYKSTSRAIQLFW